MNDRSLSKMLAELDAELAGQQDAGGAARQILDCVETRVPGAVQRSAAGIELRRLGWSAPSASG